MWVTINLKSPFFLFKILFALQLFSFKGLLHILQIWSISNCASFSFQKQIKSISKYKKKMLLQKKLENRPPGTISAQACKPARPIKRPGPKRYAAAAFRTLTGRAHLLDVVSVETDMNTACSAAVQSELRPNPRPSPKQAPSINTPPHPLLLLPKPTARPPPRRQNRMRDARSICELRPSLRAAPTRDPRRHLHHLARLVTAHVVVAFDISGEHRINENVWSRRASREL
jgi:hypothetical protein